MNMYAGESQSSVLFWFLECYVQLIQWISFQVKYALYLLKRTHKLGEKKRIIKIEQKMTELLHFLEANLVKMALRSGHLILALLGSLFVFYYKL